MKNTIKGFVHTMAGLALGGEAIKQVGNLGSAMSGGMKSATQTLIGAGILTNATKFIKK